MLDLLNYGPPLSLSEHAKALRGVFSRMPSHHYPEDEDAFSLVSRLLKRIGNDKVVEHARSVRLVGACAWLERVGGKTIVCRGLRSNPRAVQLESTLWEAGSRKIIQQ